MRRDDVTMSRDDVTVSRADAGKDGKKKKKSSQQHLINPTISKKRLKVGV